MKRKELETDTDEAGIVDTDHDNVDLDPTVMLGSRIQEHEPDEKADVKTRNSPRVASPSPASHRSRSKAQEKGPPPPVKLQQSDAQTPKPQTRRDSSKSAGDASNKKAQTEVKHVAPKKETVTSGKVTAPVEDTKDEKEPKETPKSSPLLKVERPGRNKATSAQAQLQERKSAVPPGSDAKESPGPSKESTSTCMPIKRPVGRPRKTPVQIETSAVAKESPTTTPVKRPVGRPRKQPAQMVTASTIADETSGQTKTPTTTPVNNRPIGRPRKTPAQTESIPVNVSPKAKKPKAMDREPEAETDDMKPVPVRFALICKGPD